MRRVSKKRAVEHREYSKLRALYLHEHHKCEICGAMSTEVHHRQGRSGRLLIDVSKFMALCPTCHEFVHNNPTESYSRGWMLKRSV